MQAEEQKRGRPGNEAKSEHQTERHCPSLLLFSQEGLVLARDLKIVKRLPGQDTVAGFEEGPCAVATHDFQGGRCTMSLALSIPKTRRS